MAYDVIGDIHGQAGKLRALLGKLGYRQRAGRWAPPSGHRAVFVGDLIDGVERCQVRVRGWLPAAPTYRSYAAMAAEKQAALPDLPVQASHRYPSPECSPIFLGHYWLDGPQRLDSARVACLDYSAAGTGPLVGYSWQGEADLVDSHFVAAGGEIAH